MRRALRIMEMAAFIRRERTEPGRRTVTIVEISAQGTPANRAAVQVEWMLARPNESRTRPQNVITSIVSPRTRRLWSEYSDDFCMALLPELSDFGGTRMSRAGGAVFLVELIPEMKESPFGFVPHWNSPIGLCCDSDQNIPR